MFNRKKDLVRTKDLVRHKVWGPSAELCAQFCAEPCADFGSEPCADLVQSLVRSIRRAHVFICI